MLIKNKVKYYGDLPYVEVLLNIIQDLVLLPR
jgi:hypothetical protein